MPFTFFSTEVKGPVSCNSSCTLHKTNTTLKELKLLKNLNCGSYCDTHCTVRRRPWNFIVQRVKTCLAFVEDSLPFSQTLPHFPVLHSPMLCVTSGRRRYGSPPSTFSFPFSAKLHFHVSVPHP